MPMEASRRLRWLAANGRSVDFIIVTQTPVSNNKVTLDSFGRSVGSVRFAYLARMNAFGCGLLSQSKVGVATAAVPRVWVSP